MKIELSDISLTYDDRVLFENVDLVVQSCDFLIVRGPSGSGKSSLLRLISRLQNPTSGRVLVDGAVPDGGSITMFRRQVPYLQQTPVMLVGSVRENLLFPFRFATGSKDPRPDTDSLRRWLDDMRLTEIDLDSDAETLSMGEKQRIALIRLLLAKPEILLCDEPTSALDAESRSVVESWIERTNIESGTGVVLVEHTDYRPKEAKPRWLRIESGSLLED